MARKAELWAHSVAGWSCRLIYPSACYFSSRKPPVSTGFCGSHGVTRQECERRARWMQLGYQQPVVGPQPCRASELGGAACRVVPGLGQPQPYLPPPGLAAGVGKCGPMPQAFLRAGTSQVMVPTLCPFWGSAPHPAGLAASSQLRKPHGHAALHLADRQGYGLSSGWTKHN